MTTNNFSMCQRCGTANASTATFCYQCGGSLKISEEPITCRKCNTVNVSRAAFCKNCGASLAARAAGKTKICPGCSNVVAEECTLCGKCGHSFIPNPVHAGAAANVAGAASAAAGAAVARPTAQQKEKSKEKTRRKPSAAEAKKARIGAAVSIVVLALFGALFLFRFDGALQLGFVYSLEIQTAGGAIFAGKDILTRLLMPGQIAILTTSEWILISLLTISTVCAVLYIVLSIVRLFTGKLPYSGNIFAYVMTAVSLLAVGYLMFSQHAAAFVTGSTGVMREIFQFFARQKTIKFLGLGACAIPVFWLFVSGMSLYFHKVDARPKRAMDIKR